MNNEQQKDMPSYLPHVSGDESQYIEPWELVPASAAASGGLDRDRNIIMMGASDERDAGGVRDNHLQNGPPPLEDDFSFPPLGR